MVNEEAAHNDYRIVHAAPTKHPTIALPIPQAWLALPQRGRSPLAIAANVVANGSVGFGEPLIVTVVAEEIDFGWVALGDEVAGRMVKRGEVAYSTPCVELMNMRK